MICGYTSKKEKGIFSYCSHVQSEFPLYSAEVLRAGWKICLVRLHVGLDSGWDVEGWGEWLRLSFVHSAVCAVPQSINGRTAPSPFLPRQTHIRTSDKCMTTASEKQQLARRDNRSGCLSWADCCQSGRKTDFPFLSQGGKVEELLVAVQIILGCGLTSLSASYRSEQPKQSLGIRQYSWEEPWEGRSGAVLSKWLWMHSHMLLLWSARHPLQRKKIGSFSNCNAAYAPINPYWWWHTNATDGLLLTAVTVQQAVFHRRPCSAAARLLHSSDLKIFSLMVHQETH